MGIVFSVSEVFVLEGLENTWIGCQQLIAMAFFVGIGREADLATIVQGVECSLVCLLVW